MFLCFPVFCNLAQNATSKNWPKSKFAKVEIGQSRQRSFPNPTTFSPHFFFDKKITQNIFPSSPNHHLPITFCLFPFNFPLTSFGPFPLPPEKTFMPHSLSLSLPPFPPPSPQKKTIHPPTHFPTHHLSLSTIIWIFLYLPSLFTPLPSGPLPPNPPWTSLDILDLLPLHHHLNPPSQTFLILVAPNPKRTNTWTGVKCRFYCFVFVVSFSFHCSFIIFDSPIPTTLIRSKSSLDKNRFGLQCI